jgi:signal transduction histidine kinase/DNA-binding response OmpR family regulator
MSTRTTRGKRPATATTQRCDRTTAARMLHECKEQLRTARREAQAVTRAKTRFLAVTSHEIRTPLNAIIGMADLLWETNLTAEQRQYVRMFRNAGEDLLRLINDILDLAHMDSGHFELEHIPFSVAGVLEDVCDMMALPAHAKHLELVYRIAPDVPAHLTGDPARLRQILINLINNAVKFTEQGMITIEVTRAARGRSRTRPGSGACTLAFSVTDTGVGIPADQLHSVFERFTQVDASSTRKRGGIGLGLAIARELVHLMHGRIRAQSTVGAGTTFSFTARFTRSAATPPPAVAPLKELTCTRVLITDDNAVNRMILHEMLTRAGVITSQAANGADALAAIAAAHQAGTPFDVLLLDYHMPDMDGQTVLETVRQRWGAAQMVIMMLTSADHHACNQRCQALGAVCMMKPVKHRLLVETLARLLAGVAEAPHSEHRAPVAAPAAPMRILLADDAVDNRVLVEHHLKGHTVTSVADGAAAVARATTEHYDVILMDISMPGMDGLIATKLIREWERAVSAAATPIIALTAHAYQSEIRAALNAGCTAHVSKPFKREDLLQAIAAHVAPNAGPATPAIEPVAGVALDHVPDELRALAPAFLERRRHDLQLLRAALADRRFDTIGHIGHMLKGSGGSYGFDQITIIGAQLEIAACDADGAAAADAIAALDCYLAHGSIPYA